MDKDFFGEMNFEGIKRLDKPFVINIFGLPGSGKTYASHFLAKALEIYLLSGDYVRRHCLESTEDKIKALRSIDETNMERSAILIANRIPFVFDGNDYDREFYKSLMLWAGKYGYNLINIKKNSLDEENIERLGKPKQYSKEISDFITIAGDSVTVGLPCDRELYEIRKKGIFTLDDERADYILNNTGTKEDLDNQLSLVVESIKQKNISKQEYL